jgi:hypothetical protein
VKNFNRATAKGAEKPQRTRKERKEVMKIGSWEDGKRGEKGSFEVRKLG